VEELSAMNFCAVRQLPGRAPELVTPPLAGTILHGSTRAALLTLAADHGIRVTERPIALAELLDPGAAITEAFACGTAATVVPIGGFAAETGRRRLGGNGAGPVTATLGEALLAIQFGRAPDTHGWMHRVPGLTLPWAGQSGRWCRVGAPKSQAKDH
jgi:branched-chain amino acid aminotransferase